MGKPPGFEHTIFFLGSGSRSGPTSWAMSRGKWVRIWAAGLRVLCRPMVGWVAQLLDLGQAGKIKRVPGVPFPPSNEPLTLIHIPSCVTHSQNPVELGANNLLTGHARAGKGAQAGETFMEVDKEAQATIHSPMN